jgi:hypothetical protein
MRSHLVEGKSGAWNGFTYRGSTSYSTGKKGSATYYNGYSGQQLNGFPDYLFSGAYSVVCTCCLAVVSLS